MRCRSVKKFPRQSNRKDRKDSAEVVAQSEQRNKLTDKQRAFIAEYLIDLNGTQAAIRAGYSKDTARQIATENLSKPYIRQEIDRHIASRVMTANEVLLRLTEQARGSIEDFFDMATWNFDKAKAAESGRLHVIKEFKRTVTKFNDVETETVEFKLYDAQAALEKLGKYHKLFTERLKIEDWRTEAIDLIRKGEIDFSVLAEEFDDDLATELFKSAGVPIAQP
jgi:phage terminase small subunit